MCVAGGEGVRAGMPCARLCWPAAENLSRHQKVILEGERGNNARNNFIVALCIGIL